MRTPLLVPCDDPDVLARPAPRRPTRWSSTSAGPSASRPARRATALAALLQHRGGRRSQPYRVVRLADLWRAATSMAISTPSWRELPMPSCCPTPSVARDDRAPRRQARGARSRARASPPGGPASSRRRPTPARGVLALPRRRQARPAPRGPWSGIRRAWRRRSAPPTGGEPCREARGPPAFSPPPPPGVPALDAGPARGTPRGRAAAPGRARDGFAGLLAPGAADVAVIARLLPPRRRLTGPRGRPLCRRALTNAGPRL